MTRADCPGCNSVPGSWICLFHGLPLRDGERAPDRPITESERRAFYKGFFDTIARGGETRENVRRALGIK